MSDNFLNDLDRSVAPVKVGKVYDPWYKDVPDSLTRSGMIKAFEFALANFKKDQREGINFDSWEGEIIKAINGRFDKRLAYELAGKYTADGRRHELELDQKDLNWKTVEY